MVELIVIEGEKKSGARFSMNVQVDYNPEETTVEQALLNALGSPALTFGDHAYMHGWINADWTFPMLKEVENLMYVEDEGHMDNVYRL